MKTEVKMTSNFDWPMEIKFPLPKGKNLGLPMPLFSQPPRGTHEKRNKFVRDAISKYFKVKKINATDFRITAFTVDTITVQVKPHTIGGPIVQNMPIFSGRTGG